MSDGYCGIDITPYSTILGCFTGFEPLRCIRSKRDAPVCSYEYMYTDSSLVRAVECRQLAKVVQAGCLILGVTLEPRVRQ